MTHNEFEALMRIEMELLIMSDTAPKPKTTEEADALHDDFMVRLWHFVLTGKIDAQPESAG